MSSTGRDTAGNTHDANLQRINTSNTHRSGHNLERTATAKEKELQELNAKLANPLAGYSHEELQEMGAKYAREHDMEEFQEEFMKGAMLAQDAKAYDTLPMLNDEDRKVLHDEIHRKWHQPGRCSRANEVRKGTCED